VHGASTSWAKDYAQSALRDVMFGGITKYLSRRPCRVFVADERRTIRLGRRF
jgi:hypothetical protein